MDDEGKKLCRVLGILCVLLLMLVHAPSAHAYDLLQTPATLTIKKEADSRLKIDLETHDAHGVRVSFSGTSTDAVDDDGDSDLSLAPENALTRDGVWEGRTDPSEPQDGRIEREATFSLENNDSGVRITIEAPYVSDSVVFTLPEGFRPHCVLTGTGKLIYP